MSISRSTSLTLLDESSGGDALVQTVDGDKFVVAMADAARACRAIDKTKEFTRQFRDLLTTLTEWIERHKPHIKQAHLTVRETDILFLVVQKSRQHHAALSDALTDLDIQIANSHDLDLINLEVLAVPLANSEACTAFLTPNQTITYAK